MTKPLRRATYQDVVNAPDDRVAELIGGQLFLSPRPRSRHSHTCVRATADLVRPFQDGEDGPGGWYFLIEPELWLGPPDDVRALTLVPDMAGWRRERMGDLHDVLGHTVAPDWILEVLSPSTRRLDRVHKLPRYAAAGVGHVWLADPEVRTLEAFRLDGERYTLLGTFTEEKPVAIAPFDAVDLDLGRWWLPEA